MGKLPLFCKRKCVSWSVPQGLSSIEEHQMKTVPSPIWNCPFVCVLSQSPKHRPHGGRRGADRRGCDDVIGRSHRGPERGHGLWHHGYRSGIDTMSLFQSVISTYWTLIFCSSHWLLSGSANCSVWLIAVAAQSFRCLFIPATIEKSPGEVRAEARLFWPGIDHGRVCKEHSFPGLWCFSALMCQGCLATTRWH